MKRSMLDPSDTYPDTYHYNVTSSRALHYGTYPETYPPPRYILQYIPDTDPDTYPDNVPFVKSPALRNIPETYLKTYPET